MKAWASALVLAATACSGAGGPQVGSSSIVRQYGTALSPNEVFGAQVLITATGGMRYYGEALACDDERVYLLINATQANPFTSIPWSAISTAALRREGHGGWFTAWTVLGAVSALSHGFAALLSVPLWLVLGIPSAISAGDPSSNAANCAELRPYTRFPQGMPEAFLDAHFTAAAVRTFPPRPRAPWNREPASRPR